MVSEPIMTSQSSDLTPVSPNDSNNPISEANPSPQLSAPIPAQHIAALIPLKLTNSNYLIWKELSIPVFQTYDLLTIIDGSEACPPQFLPSSSAENPGFSSWLKRDRVCKLVLHSSLSESILPYTVGSATSRDLWLNLARRFASTTRSHLLQLKARIQSLKKGSLSMLEYLQLVKHTTHGIVASGFPLDDLDFVSHVLNGLPYECDAFSTSIRVRATPITSEELHGLLLSEELAIDARNLSLSDPLPHAFHTTSHFSSRFPATHPSSSSYMANSSWSNPSHHHPSFPPTHNPHRSFRPNHNTPRPQFRHFNNTSNSRVVCQVCNKPGHIALTCRNRFNSSIQGHTPPPTLHSYSSFPPLLPTSPSASYTTLTPHSPTTST